MLADKSGMLKAKVNRPGLPGPNIWVTPRRRNGSRFPVE
jgi:hypothetical protein